MKHPDSEQILDHLLGNGPALDAHLDGCAECRAEGAAWRRTQTALAEFYAAPRRAPEGLADRLVRRLPTTRPARILSLARWVPLAAALMICLAVLWAVSRMPAPPAVVKTGGTEWIALVEGTPRKGHTHQVVLLNPATGERRPVTTEFGNYASPTFSPDGKRLAFLSDQGVTLSFVDTPAPRPLALPPDLYSYFEFSPDGTRLLCGTEVMIWLVELAGGTPRRLLGDGLEIRKATFTADGFRILYLSGRIREGSPSVFMMDLEGKNRKLLFPAGGLDFANVSRELIVHPDGKRVVFVRQNGTRIYDLLLADLDGKTMVQLDTIECTDYIASPGAILSPDGRYLLYFSARTHSLWLIELKSGVKRELTSKEIAAETSRPAFSPDGQRVVFVANPNNQAEAWQIDLDGRNPRRLAKVAWESRVAWGATRP